MLADRAERVLIVHNDHRVGDAYRDILQAAGYNCTLARNGEEALAEHRRSHQPLVITQLRLLQEFGGTELGIVLLRHFRREDPNTAVLVVSAAVEKESEVLELGASAFLQAPVKVDELLTAVQRALDERRLRGEPH